ncbi:MAG: hypothetical protein ACO3DK_07015, partial [Bacteroidia bacterium]
MKIKLTYLLAAAIFSMSQGAAQRRSSAKQKPVPQVFETVFERSNGLESPTYLEMMAFYRTLVDAYPGV